MLKFTSMSTLTFLFMIVAVAPNTASAEQWLTQRQAKSALKKLNKKDMIPTAMKCRNAPSAGKRLKPEIQITAKPNQNNRVWAAFVAYNQLDWRPQKQGSTKWTKRYKKRLSAPASGRIFNCSLWYGGKSPSRGKGFGSVHSWSY